MLTEITSLQADALIIVTTRPQGYNDDLSPKVWEHWHLAELPTKYALAYADRLGLYRHKHDIERREGLLKRIRAASDSEQIARIMVSPLQVTILYIIADVSGSIPKDRWNLFEKYYNILKQREMSKGGEFAELLASNNQHIDRLHGWAGLILHTLSESKGGAGAFFTRNKFELLLRSCLAAGDVPKDEINVLVARLMHLAINRLVLLAQNQEDKISFDVRSLQEFMAAEELTSGNTALFEPRIRAISLGAHWRHVLLIGASRCFAAKSHEHLRPVITGMIRELDNVSPEDKLIRTGARLALDLFIDGFAISSASKRVTIAEHALELLHVDCNDYDNPLTKLWEPVTKDIILSLIDELKIPLENDYDRGLFYFAFSLAVNDIQEVLVKFTPKLISNAAGAAELVQPPLMSYRSEVLQKAIFEVCVENPPSETESLIIQFDHRGRPDAPRGAANSALEKINYYPISLGRNKFSLFESNSSFGISYISAFSENIYASFEFLKNNKKGWNLFHLVDQFTKNASRGGLSDFMNAVLKLRLFTEAASMSRYFPWVISTILEFVSNEDDLKFIIKQASEGYFGDTEEWRAAENRWQNDGILASDLSVPLDSMDWRNIGTIGAPVLNAMPFAGSPRDINVALTFVDIAREAKLSDRHRKILYSLALRALSERMPIENISENSKSKIIEALECRQDNDYLDHRLFSLFSHDFLAMPEMASRLNQILSNHRVYVSYNMTDPEALIIAYKRDESFKNFLPLILSSFYGAPKERFDFLINELPTSAFCLSSEDSNITKISKIMLRIIRSTSSSNCVIETSPESIFGSNKDEWSVLAFFLSSCARFSSDNPFLKSAFAYIAETSDHFAYRNWARELLRKALDTRTSGLSDPVVWRDLGLPDGAFEFVSSAS